MDEFDITAASDDDLCAALGTLQKGHDYIEAHGFDIGQYPTYSDGPEMCYIGTVSVVAEESSRIWTNKVDKPSSLIALEVMDSVAMEEGLDRLWEVSSGAYKREGRAKTRAARRYAGELVESLGFIASYGDDLDREGEKDRALGVFRKALREVCAEMDRRES